jgi:hypothetical protein
MSRYDFAVSTTLVTMCVSAGRLFSSYRELETRKLVFKQENRNQLRFDHSIGRLKIVSSTRDLSQT